MGAPFCLFDDSYCNLCFRIGEAGSTPKRVRFISPRRVPDGVNARVADALSNPSQRERLKQMYAEEERQLSLLRSTKRVDLKPTAEQSSTEADEPLFMSSSDDDENAVEVGDQESQMSPTSSAESAFGGTEIARLEREMAAAMDNEDYDKSHEISQKMLELQSCEVPVFNTNISVGFASESDATTISPVTADRRVARIFEMFDRDEDGRLHQADVAALERQTGGGEDIDAESWAGLCSLVGASDPSAGWELEELQRLYQLEPGGAEELERVWKALSAQRIQSSYRGYTSRRNSVPKKLEARTIASAGAGAVQIDPAIQDRAFDGDTDTASELSDLSDLPDDQDSSLDHSGAESSVSSLTDEDMQVLATSSMNRTPALKMTSVSEVRVARIFEMFDRDEDGRLHQADVAALERQTGGGEDIDAESWAGLCSLVGASDPSAGWELEELQRLYQLEP
eukprot:SAG31_NODE_6453_length_2012_cov_5.163095_1_plen_453_part_01